ncbi:MAG: hypothetical protein IPI01_14725 [Ignavibacteriae bacterium]|nr:hypothetical protein [Ignavibacteriota bacterium]
MRPHPHIFRLLLLMLFLGSSASGQLSRLSDSWRWVRFGTESGLPSDIVHGIYEAGDRVTWVHTSRGLAWYDGYVWHESFIPGLSEVSARLVSICPDTSGLLVTFQEWVYSVRTRHRAADPERTPPEIAPAGAARDRDGSIILLGSALYRHVRTEVRSK